MGCSKRLSVLKIVQQFLTNLPITLRLWLGSNTQAECYFKLKAINSTADKNGFLGLYLNVGSSEVQVAQVPQVDCTQPNLYIKQHTRLPSALIGGRRRFPACLQSCSCTVHERLSCVDLFGLFHRSQSLANRKSPTQNTAAPSNPSGFHAKPST